MLAMALAGPSRQQRSQQQPRPPSLVTRQRQELAAWAATARSDALAVVLDVVRRLDPAATSPPRCASAALSRELWCCVMRFLDVATLLARVAPVCKTFCALACDPGSVEVLRFDSTHTRRALLDNLRLVWLHPRLQRLRTLDLSGVDSVTDEVLAYLLGANDGSLRELCLSDCARVTDRTLFALRDCALRLETLVLFNNANVSSRGLEALARVGEALRTLDVSCCEEVDDVGMEAVACNCRELRHLNLSECERLSADGLRMVVSCLAELRSLNVSLCAVADALDSLASPHLQELKLASCRLGDGGLEMLRHCRELRALDLTGCADVTDTAMVHLPGTLRQLFLGWVGISDAGLERVAERCPLLETLVVQRCARVTDAGVTALAKRCARLRSLDIRHVWRLTTAGVQALAAGCPDLRELWVNGCEKVSQSGLLGFSNDCIIIHT